MGRRPRHIRGTIEFTVDRKTGMVTFVLEDERREAKTVMSYLAATLQAYFGNTTANLDPDKNIRTIVSHFFPDEAHRKKIENR